MSPWKWLCQLIKRPSPVTRRSASDDQQPAAENLTDRILRCIEGINHVSITRESSWRLVLLRSLREHLLQYQRALETPLAQPAADALPVSLLERAEELLAIEHRLRETRNRFDDMRATFRPALPDLWTTLDLDAVERLSAYVTTHDGMNGLAARLDSMCDALDARTVALRTLVRDLERQMGTVADNADNPAVTNLEAGSAQVLERLRRTVAVSLEESLGAVWAASGQQLQRRNVECATAREDPRHLPRGAAIAWALGRAHQLAHGEPQGTEL